VALLLLIPAPALVISEETTRITGPLTAEGHIDFFKALEQKVTPPEFATDENGFRLFVRTFGDVSDSAGNEFFRLQRYEKLNLDPDTPPTLTFPREPQTIIKEFYEASGEEYHWRRLTDIHERPWTLEEYPMLADWIAEVDEPLDAIAEMIRKPIFFFPMLQDQTSVESGKPQNLLMILLPDVQLSREIARRFKTRALYRISQGNIDGAIDDKLTMHRLGRQVGQTGPLVQYLVGIAIEGMAVAIPVGANPEHSLTEQQIRRILHGLDTLPPRASLHDAYKWERYMGLSMLQDLAISGDRQAFVKSFSIVGGLSNGGSTRRPSLEWLAIALFDWVSFDWNVVFRRMNEFYDGLHERSSKTNLESGQFFSRIWTPGSRGTILADFVGGMLLSGIESTEEAKRRIECAGNLQRLVLAILLYQLEHGKMPGADWATQIGVPAKYFSCPSNPSPHGETTYALIQYDDSVGSLMLIELPEAVPFDKAVMTVEEMVELCRISIEQGESVCCGQVRIVERAVSRVKAHIGGMLAAHRNGAVLFQSAGTEPEELLRLLGREETSEQPGIQQPDIQPIIQAIEEAFGAVERDADGTVIGVDLALERASATDEVLKLALTLPNLKKFRLAGGAISVEAIVGLKTQTELEDIFLQDMAIRDEDFLSVVSALPKLTRLTLRRSSNITDMGIAPLFQLSALRQLALIEIPITGVSLQGIEETSTLAVLDVRNCSGLVADDYKHILRLPRLVDLRIGGFAVSDQCLEIVAQLPALRALTLDGSLVSAVGFGKFIADSPSAGTLETLVLNRNMSLNDDALLALGNLPRLRRLTLNDAMVLGTFLERLAEDEEKRPKFNDLSLRKTLLSEDKLAVLERYPELRSLQLSGVALSKSGVEMLRSLSHIERLDVTDCFLEEDAR